MFAIDKDGWVTHTKVTKKDRPKLAHGPMAPVKAIVLHRTGTTSASSVLNAWATKPEGTHFLIGEDGSIYQCASLKQQCWHVGKLYARCRTTSSCTEEDAKAIDAILHQKGTNWGQKFRMVTRHELEKDYPDRFPHNHDALGIEIVGALSTQSEIYELPNEAQQQSLFWLVDQLVAAFELTLSDIYAHGKIAHKDPKQSEGASALKAYRIYKEAG